ncbi:flagellar basal body protein, partial [Bordetella hinzii]|nr:flagellar basal body protein [Bordetella hinzii]
MDRVIYTAMNGAARTAEHQAVLSNNLANVSTPGFREQLAMYRSVPVNDDTSLPTRVATATTTPGSNFTMGLMQSTGRELDVALSGP